MYAYTNIAEVLISMLQGSAGTQTVLSGLTM